jgi:hypothetical protein
MSLTRRKKMFSFLLPCRIPALLSQTVEEYPHYPKGPCALVLERDQEGGPIHVVWGIPMGASSPAVVVTAYRPDPDLWTDDFLRRKT